VPSAIEAWSHSPVAGTQVSTVHESPSSHGIDSNVHPNSGSQESVVHAFSSSHSSGGPPWQMVPTHTSPSVHWSPSSQGSPVGMLTHPVALSHVSSVQGVWSSQSSAAPLRQLPFSHRSPTVQASPSLQAPVRG
jgi:hypothetical protein